MHWIDHEDIDLGDLRARGLEFRENYTEVPGTDLGLSAVKRRS